MSAALHTYSGLPEAETRAALTTASAHVEAYLARHAASDAMAFVGFVRDIGDGTADVQVVNTQHPQKRSHFVVLALSLLQSVQAAEPDCDCAVCARVAAALDVLQSEPPVRQ